MKVIDTIELRDVVPHVFSRDGTWKHESQVWKTGIEFHRPCLYMIEAESGTGKSSLCAYMYGSRDDYDGQILFNGKDIRTFSIKDWCNIRKYSIAFLPQDMKLFPELTVRDNIEIKNRLTRHKSPSEIKSMLETLEIDNKLDVPARFLSIGQQQRVAIVRALCQPFQFILLDEPVSHLDQRNNDTVSQLILSEAKKCDAAVIATSVGYGINIEFENHFAL